LFTGCSKEFSYENSQQAQAVVATGSIMDSLGNCLVTSSSGNYYNGVALLGDSNYVQLTIDVFSVGSYNIQTSLVNGFQFAGSGNFSDTGTQQVILRASGTPAQIQPTSFQVSYDGNTCGFVVNVQDSTGHGANGGGGIASDTVGLNQWQFNEGAHLYTGTIQSATFTNLIGSNLIMAGYTSSGTDTAFGLSFEFSGSSLDTGNFNTLLAGNSFTLNVASGPSAGNIIFASNATSSQIMSLVISSYNASTQVVNGSFSGTAYDFTGNSVQISNGLFKATVN
jgi:hypothetical protein